MTANWWTLVPIRGIASGKSRLQSVLDSGQRAALNRQLLAHTLTAIERWRGDLAQCLVVSPCEEALALARAAGARALREPGGGLNAALAFGAAQAASLGAGKLLIVACDLPDLSVDALAALAQLAEGKRRAALAPDRSGAGTNALAIDADATDGFEFGVDSCKRHVAALERNGYRNVLCERLELAFDLDTPQDYAQWLARGDARIRRGDKQSGHQQFAEAGK
jgi:2-phospho-L-lactate guanylyltransferase